MADIENKITIDNTEYIRSLKEAQKATEELNKTSIEGMKKSEEQISQLNKELRNLFDEQKKGFSSVEQMREYEKKVGDIKGKITELSGAQKEQVIVTEKVEKSTGTLVKGLAEFAGTTAVVVGAVKLFKSIMESTEATSSKLRLAVVSVESAVKYFFKTLASGDWSNFTQGLEDAIKGAREFESEMSAIQHLQNQYTILQSEREIKITELRSKARQDEKYTIAERRGFLKEQIKLEEENYTENQSLALRRLNAVIANVAKQNHITEGEVGYYLKAFSSVEDLLKLGEEYNAKTSAMLLAESDVIREAIKKERDALGEGAKEAGDYVKRVGKLTDEEQKTVTESWKMWNMTTVQFNNAVLRSQAQLDQLDTEERRKKEESNKAKVQQQTQFQKEMLQLMADYEKSEIEKLTGMEKLRAQRLFAQKQLVQKKAELQKLGALSAEQQDIINKLAVNIDEAFVQALQDQANKDVQGDTGNPIDIYVNKMWDKINKKASELKGIPLKNTDKKTFWDIFGIDPKSDKGKEQIQALKEAYGQVTDTFSDITAKQVELTQRNRELLDTRIAEAQRALELESALMAEGYANNVDAKRRELANLEVLRAEALKKEQKALKAQMALDTAIQAVNLITASTDVFKSFAKIPIVGIPLGIAMIATMFGAFIKAKSQAMSATKLAEGGSGTVRGRRHSEGGERFGDHIEVESGERWGVLSRRASDKYGKVFEHVVSSFNKGEMPSMLVRDGSSVFVNNDGSNSRLDKVVQEQKKMNRRLEKNTQILTIGNRRVIVTGNKTRIVG